MHSTHAPGQTRRAVNDSYHTHHTHHKAQTGWRPFSRVLQIFMAEFSCGPRQVDGDGAAKRRRLRRLRSWWRHEQQTVAAVLATVTHHSFGKVGTASGVLRNMETATRTGNGEEYVAHYTAKFRKTPPQGGRPAPLPALQMVEQLVEVDTFFRLSLPAVVEQVIEVPKLALPVCAVQRAALSQPQTVEQLVEVPTVLSYSLLQQRTAQQIIDIAVPRRGEGSRGGLQGLSQGQGSTAVCGADNVVSPAPHGRGGGARGGLQGLSQGQGSTALCGAVHVDIPVPHGSVGERGLHGFPRGQGSTASAVEQTIAVARLQGFPRGQSSTASAVEQTIAVARLQGFPRGQSSTASAVQQTVGVDRGGPQRFPRGQSSTASAFEQTFSQAPHRSLPQAPVHGRHDEWVCVVDVENDNEYYWNRWDNTSCWRLPRGVKHRWCLLPSGLYRDVVLGEEFWDLPPL